MLISYSTLVLICMVVIMITVIQMYTIESAPLEQTQINPLNFSQAKNNVYTYLDHKIFIQNPEILKFIDSILYYIDINPPVFLRFIDELNRYYKNIWMFNKFLQQKSYGVTNMNCHMTKLMYEYKQLLKLFDEFKVSTPPDLYANFEAQRIVFATILQEQTNFICKKMNQYNFDNKCLTRYSTDSLDNSRCKPDKLFEYELMQL